jgi:ABC-type molybdate transport system substrate-binding protein
MYLKQQQYDKAEPLYRQMLSIVEQTDDPAGAKTIEMLEAIAVFYETKGDFGAAQQMQQRAQTAKQNTRN